MWYCGDVAMSRGRRIRITPGMASIHGSRIGLPRARLAANGGPLNFEWSNDSKILVPEEFGKGIKRTGSNDLQIKNCTGKIFLILRSLRR